jgi:hypothetical protein
MPDKPLPVFRVVKIREDERPLLCVDDTCKEHAEYVDANMRYDRKRWHGDAWCKAHRPKSSKAKVTA